MAQARKAALLASRLPAPALLLEQLRAEQARRASDAERRRLAEHADENRIRCRSLAGFVREAWHVLEPGNAYVHGWHIEAICDHLEAVTDGKISRLLINVPPGTMKSLIVSVFWPAWEWGPCARPSLRYLTTSYSESYAKRDARRMRDLVSSEWYRSLWPEIELHRAAELSFETTARGAREGMPFQSLTGGRGDRVIIDDPHSTETAESEAERARTTRIFRESVPTRLVHPAGSAIVVIMQRLHERDVSGQIIALQLGYVHLMLPMEFEPERRCETAIGFRDPRSYDGELLFPERFPREVIERDKRVMTAYAVAGQYQQRPAPREGGLFKRANFPIVEVAPPAKKIARAWDFAGTSKRSGSDPDWSVGVRMLVDDDGVFYIDDIRRFRETPGVVRQTVLATASQDGSSCSIRIPQDPGQAGKAQAEDYVRALAGYMVTALPVTGNKETRAKPLAAQSEIGNVRLVRGAWNDAFLDEIEMFPAGAHDDQVDAAADALRELAGNQNNTGMIEFYARQAREMAQGKSSRPAPSDLVTMIAPEGVTTVYGRSGWSYSVGLGRRVEVDADEVAALRAAGFVTME